VEGLDWDTFREGFYNAHISTSIMNLKKEEFRTLRQGGRTLKEYMDDFFSLSMYSLDDVDTYAKRRDKFLTGLKGELKIPLSVAYALNYQALLDQGVTLDNNIGKEENRKRKFSSGKNHTEPIHKKHHSSEGSGNGSSHKHVGHFKGNGGNFNGHKHNGGFRGTTSMDTAMDTMEEMVSIVPIQMPRRTFLTSHATSVRRPDTTTTPARRTSQMMLLNLTHFRRDR
jgi:hypothetical protein